MSPHYAQSHNPRECKACLRRQSAEKPKVHHFLTRSRDTASPSPSPSPEHNHDRIADNSMNTSSPLAPALSSLRTSTALLSSSLSILDEGTRDLPRLSRVLQQTRHFELTPSSSLASAQQAVLSELVPEVERLLERVERVIERREGREEWLRARWALGQGRLGRDASREDADINGGGKERRKSVKAAKMDEAKAARLRQKKERLSYTVERLTLQAQQRERQLRMSVAKQEVRARDEGDEDELV